MGNPTEIMLRAASGEIIRIPLTGVGVVQTESIDAAVEFLEWQVATKHLDPMSVGIFEDMARAALRHSRMDLSPSDIEHVIHVYLIRAGLASF